MNIGKKNTGIGKQNIADNQKVGIDSKRIGTVAAMGLLLAFGLAVSVQMNLPGGNVGAEDNATSGKSEILEENVNTQEKDATAPLRGFSNMCAYKGKVYCGVNGVYGESIPQKSSIFTIWEDKVYYVDKVQEAYDSMTDELLTVKRSDMDGSNVEILAEDVFLAGAGHEKLVGDKLFYGYEYDENFRMKYACVDVNTKERTEITTDRIDTIVGYDGTYLYYSGVDTQKEENVLGRIHVKNGKDETIHSYASVDEEGYIDSVSYVDGKLYCFTLTKKSDSYDYRTYEYSLIVRKAENGKVEQEVPVAFTGSANYSFLVQGGEVYATLGGEIVAISLSDGSQRQIVQMKPEEYWGILHFIPGDGYLYYEAIAEEYNENGNNDYFYRVPVGGGVAELLKEWFMI